MTTPARDDRPPTWHIEGELPESTVSDIIDDIARKIYAEPPCTNYADGKDCACELCREAEHTAQESALERDPRDRGPIDKGEMRRRE